MAVSNRRTDQIELLDTDQISSIELHQNLRDIARLNRLTGTTRALITMVKPLAQRKASGEPLTVLDLGTGAGDLTTAFQQQFPMIRVIGADLWLDVLDYARQHGAAQHWVQLDGGHLPFCDGAIDVICCSQTAHHLSPDALIATLLEMRRVSRLGFLLLDLDRAYLARETIWLLTRLMSKNRLTRHDGPLSAERAYTIAEVTTLAKSVEIELKMSRIFPFRWLGRWTR